LDSAKNDKNENIGYNVPPTPEGTVASSEIPELLRNDNPLFSEEPAPSPEQPSEPSADPEPSPPFPSMGKKDKKGKRG
jgi:hypothetical protein